MMIYRGPSRAVNTVPKKNDSTAINFRILQLQSTMSGEGGEQRNARTERDWIKFNNHVVNQACTHQRRGHVATTAKPNRLLCFQL